MPPKHLKKTLLALMALAGVAGAETGSEMNTSLQELISSSDYQFGDAYTLTFNITDVGSGSEANIYYLQLADSYYLFTQGNAYAGLTTISSGDPGSAWITKTSTDNAVNTMQCDAAGAKPTGFFTWSATGEKGTLTLGDNAGNNDAGVVVTLSYNGKATTLDFVAADVTEKIIINNLSLDANDFSFNEGRSFLQGEVISFSSAPIPEPTTATLSLLALAGLAARRRRASR